MATRHNLSSDERGQRRLRRRRLRRRRLESMLACPANGNLHDASALDAMLAERASSRRDLVILILGHTNGKAQIPMRADGVHFVQAQIASLALHGISNYLVITPEWGSPRKQGIDNLCLNVLRPQGVCCGFSSAGMNELSTTRFNKGNRSWGMFNSHPYLLFVQRWWFTAQALVRGYSILSLDADLHLSVNPLEIVRLPEYRAFDVLFQGDGAWPVRERPGGATAARRYRDGDEVHVRCPRSRRDWQPRQHPLRIRAAEPSRAAAHQLGTGGGSDHHEGSEHHAAGAEGSDDGVCVCGVTAAPSLNTGFVWARAGRASTHRLFNGTVRTILDRLMRAPTLDSNGLVRTCMHACMHTYSNGCVRSP